MAIVISIVSYPFLPAKVGGQKGIALFSKYFSRFHTFICITTKKNDPSSAEGYEVLNILSNSAFRYINLFYFFRIYRIIRERKATHLLLEHPYYGWLGILLKYFAGVKLIVHSHNMEGLRWKTLGKWWWPILWSYEKWTHRLANYNFFIHDADRAYAIRRFGLKPTKCMTMTYGIEWNQPPPSNEILKARQWIRKEYALQEDEKLLLFNGAFNYSPNRDALRKILDQINPLLKKQNGFSYKIIICGRDIPEELSKPSDPHVLIAGFVEDISVYFKGCDIFINPVTEGGGIKTKLVEALGNNLNAVSTRNGALGVDPAICNGKLLVCDDGDWETFTALIIKAATIERDIPPAYFEHFYWGYSTEKAAAFIEK